MPRHALPNLTEPNRTAPYLIRTYPTPPRLTVPNRNLPYRTVPSLTPPDRTIPCRAQTYLAEPHRAKPDPTWSCQTLLDECEMIHAMPHPAVPDQTPAHPTLPHPTIPCLFHPVHSFNDKSSILRTPITETNLRTSVIYPFIDLRRIYQSIFHMKRNYGRPFFEYWAHAGHAGHFDAHKGAKAKVVIREQFICRARAIIFQLRVLQAKAARFCYLTFFGLLSAIHDHGIDHVSGQNRAIFIEIQTRQKFQPCNFFIISFGLLRFGRDLFEQFRPFVQLVCRLPVVHDQWGGRSQLVFQSLPSHD